MGIAEWISARRRESARSASTFSSRTLSGLPFFGWRPCKNTAVQCDPKPSNSDVRLSACTWTPRGLAGALNSPRQSSTFRLLERFQLRCLPWCLEWRLALHSAAQAHGSPTQRGADLLHRQCRFFFHRMILFKILTSWAWPESGPRTLHVTSNLASNLCCNHRRSSADPQHVKSSP